MNTLTYIKLFSLPRGLDFHLCPTYQLQKSDSGNIVAPISPVLVQPVSLSVNNEGVHYSNTATNYEAKDKGIQ
jgi:hypothetical protein